MRRYTCMECGYSFDMSELGYMTAEVRAHCNKVMEVTTVSEHKIKPVTPIEDRDQRIEQLENALQRLVNLATFCVPLGTKGWLEAVPQAKMVLAGESVTKPLREENKDLRARLRGLLAEEHVIKAIVECIVTHENDADYKSDDFGGGSSDAAAASELSRTLESVKITVEPDEESEEIMHVQIDNKRRSFHRSEWEWTDEQGKWPWESDTDPHAEWDHYLRQLGLYQDVAKAAKAYLDNSTPVVGMRLHDALKAAEEQQGANNE